jgi:hypothetical protein
LLEARQVKERRAVEFKPPKRRVLVWVVLSLLVAALACNAPTGGSDDVALTLTKIAEDLTITPQEEATEEPGEEGAAEEGAAEEEESAEEEEETLPPGVTPSPTECSYDARFVQDVTIPDGTEVETGEEFSKTWRMENNGCEAWPSGSKLIFLSGDQMSGPASVAVNSANPGAQVDITVVLTAPSTAGSYTGNWQLQAPDGLKFGQKVYVKIKAVEPPPPEEPTPTDTEEPPDKPDFVISDADISPDPMLVDKTITVTVKVTNAGDSDTEPALLRGEFEDNDTKDKNIPVLGPGESKDLTFNITYTSAGEYKFKFTADVGDSTDESDEDNNKLKLTRTVYRPKTYSTGLVTWEGTYCIDLEDGSLGCDSGADLFWQQVSSVERYIKTRNGAKVAVAGTSSVGYSGCSALSLGNGPINGSNNSSNEIPTGTYVCVLTNAGRISQFRVNSYGYDLEIGYTTWYLSETD